MPMLDCQEISNGVKDEHSSIEDPSEDKPNKAKKRFPSG